MTYQGVALVQTRGDAVTAATCWQSSRAFAELTGQLNLRTVISFRNLDLNKGGALTCPIRF
jgi:hypothetical protein